MYLCNFLGFQKADVVSEVGSGVVYQKNVKRYNTSRNCKFMRQAYH